MNSLLSSLMMKTEFTFQFQELNIEPKRHTIEKLIRSVNGGNGGYYGQYYQISKFKGIKVLHDQYNTKNEAIYSKQYNIALEEYLSLVQAKERFNRIPRAYGVKVIFDGEKWRIGIVMQHLDGPMLANANLANKYDLEISLKKELKAVGIIHDDLHSHNIIHHNDELWAIDFSAGRIFIQTPEEILADIERARINKEKAEARVKRLLEEPNELIHSRRESVSQNPCKMGLTNRWEAQLNKFMREGPREQVLEWINPRKAYIPEGMDIAPQNKNPFVALNAEPWKLRRGRIAPKMLIK